ncbi:MAG: type III-A CRISPR-associated RAMP protein Csm5 [Nitrospirae bacterium]|uniref:type III-A CRISPR-associated RAMP protein Csm5 n=1 Tax=Candidatus Magnetobacterium casense TaxID=1455061 RepID=UPI0005905F44|nr:type III-A CRISPR-associated RAMP protein Csm5 [Candidatus Magnetobacterium casensis]MBF0337416.1 type III-A CRISPR-associated RAMP protein Csm5 [Nitrospirota bacterium]
MEKPIHARLHVMSPVHIGCDDIYEPTSFVILRNKSNELNLAAFDPMVFVDSLSKPDREEFLGICDKGSVASIVEMMNFVAGKFKPDKQKIIVRVSCNNALLEHFKKVKVKDTKNAEKELNQFQIARTAYNPHNNLPYIPGSSIKGAMRTAYLNKLAKESKRLKCDDKDAKKVLEKQLLGGQFDTDPLRLLKVSDFIPEGEAKCKIFYAVNRKKDEGQAAKGPYQILETIGVNTVFSGTINIDQPLKSGVITNPVQSGILLKAVNDFYNSIYDEDNKVIARIKASPSVMPSQFKDKWGKSAFLIRIGRHSGAEAVTIEGYRRIKIMHKRGEPSTYEPHATTLWFASEEPEPEANSSLKPFGWAVLEIVNNDQQ